VKQFIKKQRTKNTINIQVIATAVSGSSTKLAKKLPNPLSDSSVFIFATSDYTFM